MAASRAIREAQDTLQKLRAQHPDAHCELDHNDSFTLLVAVVLSAQTTDVAVNKITPQLFARWPDAEALAAADVADVEVVLSSIGMFRQKAKNIVKLANQLVEQHGGRVPQRLDPLVALPGVGRKTANVVLGVAFGAPEGVVVDTHVLRIAQRLGWTPANTADQAELDLMNLFPKADWDILSHTVIFHGRRVCTARKPACAACQVSDVCPSAFNAENVGRKIPRRGNRNPDAKPSSAKRAPKPPSTQGSSTQQATTKGSSATRDTANTPTKKKVGRKPKK